ncbi:SAM-dependent methyltransferase [Saccharothrix saharensis]|uniref:SAM-dependent methyltransferase n=1 Tax=Saccharothrix saharensis TaxID=571190 RepID=UPI0036C48665
MNATTRRILATIAEAGEHGLDGLGIQAMTALGVGTSYPHLVRLDTAGLVTHTWEQRRSGTPRRRLYRVTDLGRAEARQLELLPPSPRSIRRPQWPWKRPVAGPGPTGSPTRDGAPPDAFSTGWPHPVLVRNHLLGGTLNRSLDKAEAARLRALDPDIDTRARAVETYRDQVLRTLADRGVVEQVLDLTTGVPATDTVRSAHVALADHDPPIPVVYVVTDEQLAKATKAIARHRPHVHALLANPCDARTVWQTTTNPAPEHPSRLMHPGRPVVLDAVTISDLVPDPRRLRTVLRAWRTTVRPGSVLLLARSLDPALPDPLTVAERAGWHRVPGIAPPRPDTDTTIDHRAQIAALTTSPRRWPRRPDRT